MNQRFAKYILMILLAVLTGLNHLNAQMVGGNTANQSAPKEVKASDLSKGAYTSDVNLFNGTMGTSYDLGTVSTPSGLSFNLQLSHSSAKTVGNNPLVVAGIPYGDGWNVNAPTISISTAAYEKYNNADISDALESVLPGHGPVSYADYSKQEFSKEGEIGWFAPIINIPGVINERFIFKAYDSRWGEAVFVPAKMDKYVEARMKYGSYWKVTNDNGDVYSFNAYSSSYRAPQQLNFTEDSMRLQPSYSAYTDSTSFTVTDNNQAIASVLSGVNHLSIKIMDRDTSGTGKLIINYWILSGSFVMQDNLLPKQEFNTWYCDYIYNKNSPMNQQIWFRYSSFGNYDFFEEMNQHYLNQQLSVDFLIDRAGSIPAFKFSRDVILENVSSYYSDRGMIEEIELVHQTVLPSSNAGAKNMLLLTENSVQRLDSLYNYRIVYSQGVNTATDSLWLKSNAYNHSAHGLNFNAGINDVDDKFVNWRRYFHVMSDNPIVTAGRPIGHSGQHHTAFGNPSNPYLFSANGTGGAFGTGGTFARVGNSIPFYKYDNASYGLDSTDLKFDHCFLESPRIVEDIIPGDIYQVRSVIKNDSLTPCNFDVNIVSGYPVPQGNTTYSFGEKGDTTNKVLDQTDYETGIRGVSIFSTFGNPIKWTSYANTSGQSLNADPPNLKGVANISNFFLMPTIPKKFRGVNIQVGPANSDIDYSLDQQMAQSYAGYYSGTYFNRSAWLGYKKIQEDATNGQDYQDQPLPDPHYKPSSNFGIGMPWFMMNELYTHVSGDLHSNILNNNYRFWWRDYNSQTLENDVTNYVNTPTMAGRKVTLSAMELVRYSKNPYMLVSVKKYKYNGYGTNDAVVKNKYLVNQLNIKYEVRVDSLFTNTYSSFPARVFIEKEFVCFQNTYLLNEIKQIPVNGALGNAASSFALTNLPTTHFTYSKLFADSLFNYSGKYDVTGNLYAIRKIVDQLGGVMEYDYYPLHDTKHTHWADQYYDFNFSGKTPENRYNMPSPDVYKIQIAVKAKRYYNSTLAIIPTKTWLYEYTDSLTSSYGVPYTTFAVAPTAASAPAHYRFNSQQVDFGFKKTTVSYPQLASGGAMPYDVYTHYSTENLWMTFGKLKQIEKYDGFNRILNKKEYVYKKSMAYGNYMLTDNRWGGISTAGISGYQNLDKDEYYYTPAYAVPFTQAQQNGLANAIGYNLEMATDFNHMPFLEVTNFSSFQPITGSHYGNCYFVRLIKEINTDYDYGATKVMSSVLANSHFRGVQLQDTTGTNPGLLSGINSFKLGLSEVNETALGVNFNSTQLSTVTEYEYWDADSTGLTSSDGFRRLLNTNDSTDNKKRLLFEPSWELFRTNTYSPQLPQSYKKTEHYYYYDAKQEVNILNSNYPHPEDFDALYYSHRYGIRNLPYQKREIGKAVSHPEVSKSEYYWYDTKTLTDTVFINDTLYITGLTDPCNPTTGNPGPGNPEPNYGDLTGCIPIPHPFVGLLAGYHYSQSGPNDWMMCPDVPPSSERPLYMPSDLDTKLLLRRVDEQVDTIRTDLALTNKYYPVLRFLEYYDPGDAYTTAGYDYNWIPNFYTRTKYLTLEHTTLGFVREDVNERGLHTHYDYHPVYSTTFIDTINPCNNGGAFDLTNQGVPECIIVGLNSNNDLTTCYSYNPDFTINSIIDPNGMVLSYAYDNFSRMRMARRNNDTLSFNAYSQWLNDTTLSFEDRANQNYVESFILLNKGSKTAEHSRAYIDPLGRKYDVQTQVTTNYTNPTQYDNLMVHSGLTTYDNWDRVEKQYKPFVYTNSGSPVPFAPRFNPTGLFTEQKYEPNQRGQVLRASKFGENITTGHTVNSSYQIITGLQLKTDLGTYASSYINELTGTTHQNQLTYQRYVKTSGVDEDGKKTISYANPFGQKIATKTYSNGFTYQVTAFIYDSQGNLKKVVKPNLQTTTYEYNLCGNMFRKVSADAGTVKYMYDISGNVVLEQDANGKHGVDETSLAPYMRKYTYDIFGRMIQQDRVHYDLNYDPLYYKPDSVPAPEDHSSFYNFSHSSSLDYLGGWLYYKCSYVLDGRFTNPAGNIGDPVIPVFPGGGDPGGSESPPCRYVFVNPYDSLEVSAPEKAWMYHQHSGYDFEFDALTTITQNHLLGRLTTAKSYLHDGTLSSVNAYSYNNAGLMEKELIQFKNPLAGSGNIYSIISYPSYNLRNSLLEQQIDVNADGTNEIAYNYVYDGWNRLKKTNVKRGVGSYKQLATYSYNDALGLVTSTAYYNPNLTCSTLLGTDNITYSYDNRNRLTTLQSNLFKEELNYDLNLPQTKQAAFGVTATKNFNGNINGLIHTYKLTGTTNYASTGGIMDSSTVYGYTYDGINRLTNADASVLNVLNYPVGSAVYTPRKDFGDETMTYDAIGNMVTLNRALYYNPGISTPANYNQNWKYNYTMGTNKLGHIDSVNNVNLRIYRYDTNGNTITEMIDKATTKTDYMRSNLPKHTSVVPDTTGLYNTTNVYYDYNNADDRIYKEAAFDHGGQKYYYLRDASGKELAEYNMTANTWTHYGYGRERIAEFKGSTLAQISYYNYDHLGNVRVMYSVNDTCDRGATQYTIQSANDYYAFGKTLRSFNSSKYNFIGKERDVETNLDYVDARNYDSEIGRWTTNDPLKDKMPQWSPYNYALNNPVIMIDNNGEYPIYIYVRSFAPFKVFGASNWVGDGANRPFSTSSSYSSRLSMKISYETTTTERLVTYMGSTSIGLIGPVISKSEADQDAEFGLGNDFKTHLSGNDDAIVPGMDGTFLEDYQSPNIDVHNSFYITEDKENNLLMISGQMTGDAFPSAEAYVKDGNGTGLFLAASPAQYGPDKGPFKALFFDNNRPMGDYGMKISVDSKGSFMGVQVGDKVVSPEAWNKQFEEMNPKSGPPTTR